MPKLKTHRAAKKRFSYTGTGKIKRSRANGSHLLTHKSAKRKRVLKQSTTVVHSEFHKIRELLPYSK
ncbi:MAG TPA: 50S ribosomal protein L35 [Candidatus Aminicenantes bacterium]|nr:50S ribosomal protein L35 [Candidatus Aminicenantes bacterium]